jgi:hypothetical protein
MRSSGNRAELGLLALLVVGTSCRLVDNPYLPIGGDSGTDGSNSNTVTDTDTGPESTDTDTSTDTNTDNETNTEESLWCPDMDEDTYGDGTSPMCVMTSADMAPSGFVDDVTDCDDTSSFTHPGAAEDDNPSACMRDEDMDGWGSEGLFEGVTPGRDCDDVDATAVACVIVIDACLDTNLGVAAQLEALAAGGVPPYDYAWTPVETLDDPSSANPLAQPATSTSYAVSVTDQFAQPHQSSAEATVHVVDQPWILAGNQTSCSTIGFGLNGAAVMLQAAPEGTQLCTQNAGIPTAIVCPVEGRRSSVSIQLGASTPPSSDGFFAVVWGWQNASQFYALIWKRGLEDYGNCVAEEGMVVKLFDKLANYAEEEDFYCSTNSLNQTVLLDPSQTFAGPWLPDHTYRVILEQDAIGTHIEVHDDTLMAAVASFDVVDVTYPTGRVGLLFMEQPDLCAGPVLSQCQ